MRNELSGVAGSGAIERPASLPVTDLEIARATPLQAIDDVAARAGIPIEALHHYGRHIAKLDSGYVSDLAERQPGKLILVTAISPTPAGEGKTTTTIGLGDALNRIGARTMICLREPSLGPCFGQKGGATGGGRSQVVPMERINLHFTGDFHAITSANNLLAAMLDNHVYWGNSLGIDERRVALRRVLDVNDRALRTTGELLSASEETKPTAVRMPASVFNQMSRSSGRTAAGATPWKRSRRGARRTR